MSTTIDSKVVEMKFNNKDFEKNAAESIRTLDSFKKKLSFEESIKSIGHLADTLKNVSFDKMTQNIGSIATGFSATGAIVFGVLQNMVNAALNAGQQITNALFIDPVKLGFQEYETQMNSVQTILANTQTENTTLDVVMSALDELNDYADRTIYNFTQMTRNIGTFTAAGVKLDVSVSAIKGIANLAAISGSNADQASTAMYQLSQALAAGSVKLMDWNSVVNAGMGGKVFQDALTETARVHGVAIDDMIKQEGGFRNTLQNGWLTSEILTETLSKFTGDLTEDQLKAMGYTEEQIKANVKLGQMANDAATKVKTFTQLFDTLKEAAQSGWAKTWQIVIGDFYEAKVFMTELSDMFGGILIASADSRNNFLEGWDVFGGRVELIRALRNTFDALFTAIAPIKEALREVFPPMTYITAFRLTKALADFTEKLKMGEGTIAKVKTVFKGLFSLLDIGRMALVAIGEGLVKLINPAIGPTANGVLDFLVKAAEYIINLRDSIKVADSFGVIVQRIGDFLGKVRDNVSGFFSAFISGFSGFDSSFDSSTLLDFLSKLKDQFKPFGGLIDLLGRFASGLASAFNLLAPFFLKLGTIMSSGINAFLDRLTDGMDSFNADEVFSLVNNGLFAGFLLALKSFVDKGSLIFGDISKAIGSMGGISEILGSVRGSLEAWQSNLKADTLLKLAGALGILALSILIISTIDSGKLVSSLTAMTAMFVQLVGALTVLDKTSSLSINGSSGMAIALIGISTAMLIMSAALAKLGTMDPVQLVRGMVAITLVSGLLIGTAKLLSKESSGMITSAAALVVFAYAIDILSKSIKTMGEMKNEDLIAGLSGVSALLLGISLFLSNTKMTNGSVAGALGVLVLSAALNIMVLAVEKMGNMDSEKMTQGLVGIGTLLGGIVLFTNNVTNSGNLLVAAFGLTILAGALLLMTISIERLSDISWEGLAKGLVGIGAALLIILTAISFIPPNLAVSALSLLIVAGSIFILAEALAKMGNMSWEQMGVSMAALAGSLTLLALGLYAMTASLPGAAALVVAAGALMVLAPALLMLGGMSLEDVGIAMLALAGIFVVLGIAGSVLTTVTPTLLALAGAIFLLGIGVAAVGAGMFLFASGLMLLSGAGAAVGASLTLILTSIVSLIPMLFKQLGRALLILVDVLVAGAPALLEGIITVAVMLIDGLIVLIPKLVDGIYVLLSKVLIGLAENLPDFIKAGYEILLAILTGIKDNIGEIAETIMSIVVVMIDTLAAKLPDLVEAGYGFIISYIDAIAAGAEEYAPQLIEALSNLAMSVIEGIVKGLIAGRSTILTGIWEIATILIDEFKRILGIASPSTIFYEIAGFIISGLTDGLLANMFKAIGAVANMAQNIINVILNRVVEFLTLGILIVENLKTGITDTAILVFNVVMVLINSAISVITNKYNEIKLAGINFVLGFTTGVKDYINRVISSATSMANSFVDAVRSKYDNIRNAGINFVLGFIGGINDYIYQAVQAAFDLASSVVDIIADVLGIASPSKVLYAIAKFIVMGLTNGISDNSGRVVRTTDEMANQAVSGFENMMDRILSVLNSDLNLSPVITPVLDMDDVIRGSKQINNLFKNGLLSLDTSSSIAGSIGQSMRNESRPVIEREDSRNRQSGGESITYVQNNYSPRELNRLEIYRQTRNQIKNSVKGRIKPR
jgi:tape measure domain-containing protein